MADGNNKPRRLGTSAVTAGAVCVIGAAALLLSLRYSGNNAAVPGTYFTTDDGATFFTESATRTASFEHNGKTAVRAHVYRSKDGRMEVGWMERLTARAAAVLKKQDDAARAGKPSPMTPEDMAALQSGTEYKLRGDTDWKPKGANGSMFAVEIAKKVKSSDGSPLQEVEYAGG